MKNEQLNWLLLSTPMMIIEFISFGWTSEYTFCELLNLYGIVNNVLGVDLVNDNP